MIRLSNMIAVTTDSAAAICHATTFSVIGFISALSQTTQSDIPGTR